MEILAVAAPVSTALGVIITGLFAYWLAKRRLSGNIATTDANDLWNRLMTQLDGRDVKIEGLHGTVLGLMAEMRRKDERIDILETQVGQLTAELSMKDSRIRHLEEENGILKQRVKELETRAEAIKQAGKALADGGA